MNYDEYMKVVQENVLYWLKQGVNPWQASWTTAKNAESKRRYSGNNAWFLTAIAARYYDGDPRFLTFDQVQKLGYRIKKGSHGHPAYFYQSTSYRVKKDEDGNPVLDENGRKVKEKVKIKPVFQVYTVFNAKQIEGMPEYSPTDYPDEEFDKKTTEAIITNSPVKILHDQLNSAFYTEADDAIHIPSEKQFTSTAGYYSTVFHEMIHATGTPERLNRESLQEYAAQRPREELTAELGAVMLCNNVGLKYENPNSAAYIAGWATALEDKSVNFKTLYGDVSKATHYLKYPADRERLHKEAVKTEEQKKPERDDIPVPVDAKEILLTNGDASKYILIRRTEDSKWECCTFNAKFKRGNHSVYDNYGSLQEVIEKTVIPFTPAGDQYTRADLDYKVLDVPGYGPFIDAGQPGLTYVSKAGGDLYGKEYLRIVPVVDSDDYIVRHFTVSGQYARSSYSSKEEIAGSGDPLFQIGYPPEEYEPIPYETFADKERSLDFDHWKWIEKNSSHVSLHFDNEWKNSSIKRSLSLSEASYQAEEQLIQEKTPYTIFFQHDGEPAIYKGEFDPSAHISFLDSVSDAELKTYLQAMQKLEERENLLTSGSAEGFIEASEDYKNEYLDYIAEQRANANTGKPVDWENFPSNQHHKKDNRSEEKTAPEHETEPYVTIPFTESGELRQLLASYPEGRLPFAEANKILDNLNTATRNESGYFKTDFEIHYDLGDEESTYKGRYDIGSEQGDLIAHIEDFLDYCLTSPHHKNMMIATYGEAGFNAEQLQNQEIKDRLIPVLRSISKEPEKTEKPEEPAKLMIIPRWSQNKAAGIENLIDKEFPYQEISKVFAVISARLDPKEVPYSIVAFDAVYRSSDGKKDTVIDSCNIDLSGKMTILDAIRNRIEFKNSPYESQRYRQSAEFWKEAKASVLPRIEAIIAHPDADIEQEKIYISQSGTRLLHAQLSSEGGIDWTIYECDPEKHEIKRDLDGGQNDSYTDINAWMNESDDYREFGNPSEVGGYKELSPEDGKEMIESFLVREEEKIKKINQLFTDSKKAESAYKISRNEDDKRYYQYLMEHASSAMNAVYEGKNPQPPKAKDEYLASIADKNDKKKGSTIDRIQSLAKSAQAALPAANEEDRQYLDYIIRYAGEAQAKQQVTGNDAIPLPLSRKAFEKQRESKQIEAEHRAIRR